MILKLGNLIWGSILMILTLGLLISPPPQPAEDGREPFLPSSAAPGYEKLSPCSVVMQYMHGELYHWEEYNQDGHLRIMLRQPEKRLLSAREADKLLQESSTWQQELQTSEAITQQMGEDDRVEVENTEDFPWNTVGKLEAYFEKDENHTEIFSGTAFLVSPYVALTNAHNIYDPGRETSPAFARFYPGRYGENGLPEDPFDYREITRFEVNQAHYEDPYSIEEDYGALFLEEPFTEIDVFMPLEFDYEPQEVGVVGYPEIVDGGYNPGMMKSWDDVMQVEDKLIYSANYSSPGNSGGPVLVDDFDEERVVGIISAKETEYDLTQIVSFSLSVRLTEHNRKQIEDWMDWELEEPGDEDPPPQLDVNRLFGEDRYETAVEISKEAYPDGSGAVVLAQGEDFADALTGVSLALNWGGPLLITPPQELHPQTETEIQRLMPGEGLVFIMGGEAAISQEVEDELVEKGYQVERIAGEDRYETAVKVAEEHFFEPPEIFLSTGENFADAVSVSSAAALRAAPILLTEENNLPEATSDYLDQRGGQLTQLHVIGGTAAVSEEVYQQAGANNRVAGEDRWETSVKVADKFFSTPYHATVAAGSDFPDAMSGGVFAALRGAPVLLSPDDELPAAVRSYLQELNDLNEITLFGGEAVLSPEVLRELETID